MEVKVEPLTWRSADCSSIQITMDRTPEPLPVLVCAQVMDDTIFPLPSIKALSSESRHYKMEKDDAFEKLLTHLEPDYPDTERRYKQLRLKMVKFFAWRRCHDPESLADETISRTVKNITAGEEIYTENVYSYIYGIAKYVFMEYIRDNKRQGDIINGLDDRSVHSSPSASWQDCRRECLEKLPPDKLKLLQEYYLGEESRERLAQALNVTLNALRLQVHRIKQELRDCYKNCLK